MPPIWRINTLSHKLFHAQPHLTAMKNLMDELLLAGFTKEEAGKTIEVVYEWMEVHYPVLAAMARTTMLKESALEAAQKVPGTEP
jgi:hypothetical protein